MGAIRRRLVMNGAENRGAKRGFGRTRIGNKGLGRTRVGNKGKGRRGSL